MNGFEIAILIVVCVGFLAAVVGTIVGKIKHKGGCDCGGNCATCAGCGASAEKEKPACPHK